VQIFADYERRFRRRIELAVIERSKDGCAALQIQAHSRSKAELSGGVLAGRHIYRATSGFSASIDSFLDSGPRVVLPAPGCAVVLHVVHRLAGKIESGRGDARKTLAAKE